MFTVLLLSPAAQERFEQWKEIFMPFIEDGRIAVTDWKGPSTAWTLSEAAPDLGEAIHGHEIWRLLVVGTGSEGAFGLEQADPVNPFDFVGNWPLNETSDDDNWGRNLEESQYPVVRLTHMVMGYPEMGTKAFFADASYWDREQRRRIYESEYVRAQAAQGVSEDLARDQFKALLPSRHDVQTHYHQDDYSQEEQHRYRELIKRYEVKLRKPSEFVLLGIRDPIAPRPRDELRESWQRGAKADPSRFAERNGYHPAARFVLFDRPPADHAAFDLGEMRFWLSVLTLAINEIPASSLQAERLYQMDVDISPDELSAALNLHLGKLTSARDHLETEIRRPRSFTRLDVEDVLRRKEVAVSFEHLNGDELSIPVEGYGLARDRPVEEMTRWNDSYLAVESAAEVFHRKPKRVLAKAVEGTRDARPSSDLPTEPLTEIEREELEEQLANQAQSLAVATTRDILDRRRLDDLLRRQRSSIRSSIHERMSSGTIWLGSALVGVVWLAAFVPFIIQAVGDGGVAAAESILVVLAIAGLLVSVGVTILLIMRKRLRDQLKAFNRELREYVNSVKAGASAFAEFLSGIETFMHGRAILDEQERQARNERRRLHDLHANLEVLRVAIAREKSLIKSVGRQVEIRRLGQGTSEFEPWREDSLRRLLALPIALGSCEFNTTGEYIDAPFTFVDRLTLINTVVREDIERQRILSEEMGAVPNAGESRT